jgi:hypothetical protein
MSAQVGPPSKQDDKDGGGEQLSTGHRASVVLSLSSLNTSSCVRFFVHVAELPVETAIYKSCNVSLPTLMLFDFRELIHSVRFVLIPQGYTFSSVQAMCSTKSLQVVSSLRIPWVVLCFPTKIQCSCLCLSTHTLPQLWTGCRMVSARLHAQWYPCPCRRA